MTLVASSPLRVVPGDMRLRPVERGWLRKQNDTPRFHQQEKTHDIVVDGTLFAWDHLVSEVVSRAVDAEHQIFLERPSGDVARRLFILGLLAAEQKTKRRDQG
jgi:hypothetical protein